MAKADWCTVAPMSGNGDGTLTISALAHTGRTQRSTMVTVQAQNGAKPSATIQVNQAGASVGTSFLKTEIPVPKEGAIITIQGTSNSPILKRRVYMVLPNTGDGIDVSSSIADNWLVMVNGQSIGDRLQLIAGASVPGDPGAQAAYDFSVSSNVPGGSAAAVTWRIEITDDAGNVCNCNVNVPASASRASVSPTALSLSKDGKGQNVNVTSNDDWTVS